ncbi:MAG: hypothetical protein IJJ83_05010 [Muribaculaceae bacterium]|nr:hypothetical protein [Muribaculaceae bacterium]
MKLTTLLFGLLLAVGWTSSAYAQSSPNNHSDAVHPKSYYDALTYTWENPNDGEGVRTSKSTDLATDPYQIYELLRFVYGNPAFPGPKYAGYNYNGTVREDPVSYGPIQGCWNIVAADNPRDIKIQFSQNSTNYSMDFTSIEVRTGNNAIDGCSWTYNTITGRFVPTSWNLTGSTTYGNNNNLAYFRNTGGTITIPAGLLEDYTDVQVIIRARAGDYANYYTYSITVNGETQRLTSTSFNNYTWNVTLPAKTEIPFVKGTVATPYEDGYTALMVSVYDDAKKDTSEPEGGSYFSTVQQFINYITPRIKSVQLLTDGLRIGSVEEQTSGTVFNCSGTYNKFFIIGKGQAREKADRIKNMAYGNDWEIGEAYPFQTMFEQFSPTTTDKDADIKDFYTEMQDGHVYSVVHDCGTILQEEHQFSMSGNNGTQSYAMSGLNFFIPDYRLKFWTTTSGSRTVDGRDIIPYQTATTQGKTNTTFNTNSYWNSWWANYNPTYAPKIGIYKITLDAEAKKTAGYDVSDPYYDVTLNWVSSLNELSGEMVHQTYEIYIVHYNEDGTETQELLTTVTDETTYTYQVKQEDESKTITYIIKGYPTPGDELQQPSFVAWSNLDDVVIPGLNDFLNLILDHYESDFVIGNAIGTEKNYYRNFMHVAAENEDNALTVERINAGENLFTLYRYDASKPQAEQVLIPVGELSFWDRHDNKTVGYGFSFPPDGSENAQVVEDYTLKTNDGQTITNAYSHDKLGMPQNNNGFDLRIKGNGDIVIQPNGYDVNFYEISVYNESNTRIAHWQVSDGDVTSLSWYLSPGSKWVRDAGTDYYYLEGGGFIAIPNMLNNNELRVVIRASRDEGKLGQIKVNDHTVTLDGTSAQNYEWSLNDKYYKYVKVLNQSELTAGEYLIVNEGESVAFDGSKGMLDAAYNYLNVEILNTGESHEILDNSLVENATFTIDPQAGTVKSASGYYIGLTANSNGLRQSTDPITNVITMDGIEAHIKNQTSTVRELRYNNTSGTSGKRFRYYPESTQQPIQLYKKVETTKPVGESIVRLGSLPIIDQFAVSVADNQHPSRYGYVLKYVPGANVDPNNEEAMKPKTSSHVEVPVQKTGSVVNGFYTESQVKADSLQYNTVKVDVKAADMQMNLSNTNSAVFYYSILSNDGAVPQIDTDSTYYVSNLQNDNFTYQEMFKKSPNIGDRYEAGEHHYYVNDTEKGTYGKMGKTYVPFVTTRAIDRFYFVEDSLHNTYGSPIWATSVGQAKLDKATAQKQLGWNTTWTDASGNTCKLYMLDNVQATGYLPVHSNTVSNVGYEPYMFRLFVKSKNGRLRNYTYETNAEGNKVIVAAEGTTEGPLCVWSGYLKYDAEGNLIGEDTENGETYTIGQDVEGSYIFTKKQVDGYNAEGTWNADKQNAIFGALDALQTDPTSGKILKDELEIIVRFYFKAKGAAAASNSMTFNAGNRDGEEPAQEVPMYNAAEDSGETGVATAVEEIRYHGEVVSTTYYNVQGIESDKPFQGVNIVVTRFSDGTTSVSKVVR